MDPINIIIDNWQIIPWYKDGISFFALILSGVAIILPDLRNFFKQPKFYGKIINTFGVRDFEYFEYKNGDRVVKKGIGYFIKIALTLSKKSFDFKNIEVNIRYPNDKRVFRGEILKANTFWSNLEGLGLESGKYWVKIASGKDILSLLHMDEDQSKEYYMAFGVDKGNFENFKEVELVFTDYNNKSKKLILSRKDLNENNNLFERDVWVKKK
ncbi:MAG: hypothetical protein UR31_C0034G0002 [Parcubacteria group bacterium GW2011_GWA2_33_14]|nr:MAG: hypothetical protein UR31_C0034G0002 [Parcubacteria group bacterium GW2011_GWA2_33_14]